MVMGSCSQLAAPLDDDAGTVCPQPVKRDAVQVMANRKLNSLWFFMENILSACAAIYKKRSAYPLTAAFHEI